MMTIEMRPLSPADAASVQGLTYPSYRHLLSLQPQHRHPGLGEQHVVQPLAIVAWGDTDPVGLALAELPMENPSAAPEVLSLFVAAPYRNQGIATRMLEELEQAVARRAFDSLTAVYMTGKPGTEAVERVLAKRGWDAPVTRSVTTRFTLDEAERTPWFGRVQLPESEFQFFSWSDLSPQEKADLRRSHERDPWIAEGLEPRPRSGPIAVKPDRIPAASSVCPSSHTTGEGRSNLEPAIARHYGRCVWVWER